MVFSSGELLLVAGLLVVVAVIAFVPVAVWLVLGRPTMARGGRMRHAERWAQSNDVDRAAAADPAIAVYLSTNRALRRIGFVAGLVLPMLLWWSLGIDGASRTVAGLWPWLGYLGGCLWAELTVKRVPGAGARVASLETRRVRDYLPGGLWWAQRWTPIVGVVAMAFTFAVSRGWSAPTGGETVGELALGQALALVLVAVMWWAQRRIVVRPQPFDRDSHRAVDDALRATTMRRVGATVVLVQLVLVSEQLGWIVSAVTPGSALLFGPAAVMVGGYVLWLAWIQQGWRPRSGVAPADVAGGAHA